MIPVIDLFAGPGGLGEGFSSLCDKSGKPVFQTIMSVERDPLTYETLRLRSYVRKIFKDDGSLPRVYLQYMAHGDKETRDKLIAYRPDAWKAACKEAVCATLVEGDSSLVNEATTRILQLGDAYRGEPLVLIGGPPCQAYSLVGRSRRAHDANFDTDEKHTLYKCYLAFINELKPDIFVMENVRGLLSAKHKGEGVFAHILDDMDAAGYEIRSLVKENPEKPDDYVVEAEHFGIPQMRHRVILLGIRKGANLSTAILHTRQEVSLGQALTGIPKIRSGFSEHNPDWRELNWAHYIDCAAKRIEASGQCNDLTPVLERVISSHPPKEMSKAEVTNEIGIYDSWYRGRFGKNKYLSSHVARTHLAMDLDRYLFCAAYAEIHGVSARLEMFPDALLPNHKNVQKNIQAVKEGKGGYKFNDRFRVQLASQPSTTITCHIAKDGHYYIHPDPIQCRSLTVREAARLQTFPDDYLFEGSRTSQYTQVGNAVPPLLAQQIASIVAAALGKETTSYVERVSPSAL